MRGSSRRRRAGKDKTYSKVDNTIDGCIERLPEGWELKCEGGAEDTIFWAEHRLQQLSTPKGLSLKRIPEISRGLVYGVESGLIIAKPRKLASVETA